MPRPPPPPARAGRREARRRLRRTSCRPPPVTSRASGDRRGRGTALGWPCRIGFRSPPPPRWPTRCPWAGTLPNPLRALGAARHFDRPVCTPPAAPRCSSLGAALLPRPCRRRLGRYHVISPRLGGGVRCLTC